MILKENIPGLISFRIAHTVICPYNEQQDMVGAPRVTLTKKFRDRRSFAVSRKWSRKYYKLIASFATFLQWLHLNNYLAWFYKRGKRGLSYLDVAIATMFCQCNSRKLVAKIFGQCRSAATQDIVFDSKLYI